jgi:ribosomal protein S18 acetylase RimI-like enzyme
MHIAAGQEVFLNFSKPLYYVAESKFNTGHIPVVIIDEDVFAWNGVVGFCSYGIEADTETDPAGNENTELCYRIAGFMIFEKYQRKGYGKKAMELLINKIKADKTHNKISLNVHEENTAAIKLYASLGFDDKGPEDYRVDDETGKWIAFNRMELVYS